MDTERGPAATQANNSKFRPGFSCLIDSRPQVLDTHRKELQEHLFKNKRKHDLRLTDLALQKFYMHEKTFPRAGGGGVASK